MDYKKYRDAIGKRVSNRKFTGASIPEDKLVKLKELVGAYNKESGLSMQVITGDNGPFEGGGIFGGSAGYLALVGKANDSDRMEKEGYFGELFVLEATSMGIGTCWVASSFGKDKSKAVVADDEVLDLGIVFGIAEPKLSIKEKMIRKVLAPNYDAAPEWFQAGVDAAMKSPSTKNTMPFAFTYEGTEAYVHATTDHECVMVDLGIAKLHFEVGAGGTRKCDGKKNRLHSSW